VKQLTPAIFSAAGFSLGSHAKPKSADRGGFAKPFNGLPEQSRMATRATPLPTKSANFALYGASVMVVSPSWWCRQWREPNAKCRVCGGSRYPSTAPLIARWFDRAALFVRRETA